MMKVGLIGFGNMAQALAKGWINARVLRPDQILASDTNKSQLEAVAAQLGIVPVSDNQELCRQADVIVIAVKPFIIEKALEDCQNLVGDKMIINLAVNQDFEAIEKILPQSHHISILPNLCVEVAKGVVLAERKNSLDQDQLAQFEKLFYPISTLEVVDAAQFSIGGILTGCGPAFCALFIEALADAGVQYGLSREMAYTLSLKMAEGSMALMADRKIHPGVLKDMVSSPSGTTIVGVNKLKELGFEGDLIQAVQAIRNKK